MRAVPAAAPTKRILMVDDFPFGREALADVMREWGYEVDEADNAEQALAKVPVFQPDAVICDLTLGRDIANFAGLRRLRESVGPNVQVVVYTGYSQHEEAAKEAGCDEYVLKPDLERLKALYNATGDSETVYIFDVAAFGSLLRTLRNPTAMSGEGYGQGKEPVNAAERESKVRSQYSPHATLLSRPLYRIWAPGP